MNRYKHIAIDCLCMILYMVLYRFLHLNLGPIHIVFCGLPVMFAALLFGPKDGLIVGLLGSFLSELIGPYGIGITTPLWMLSAGLIGLIPGLYKNANMALGPFALMLFLTLCADTAVNIGAAYFDSLVYKYPFFFSVPTTLWQLVADIIKAVIYTLVLRLALPSASPAAAEE